MKALPQDPKVAAAIDKAVKNAQKFFAQERRAATKRALDLVTQHAVDAKAAGNPDAARRMRGLVADLRVALK